MSDWFTVTPERERLLSEERLILNATEKVYEALEFTQDTKKSLSEKLGISKSEVGQRLSGRRNLTIRSLASMLYALGYEATIGIRPLTGHNGIPRDDLVLRRQRKVSAPTRAVYQKHHVSPTAGFKKEMCAG